MKTVHISILKPGDTFRFTHWPNNSIAKVLKINSTDITYSYFFSETNRSDGHHIKYAGTSQEIEYLYLLAKNKRNYPKKEL